jgi:hypothetical protein
MTGQATFSLAEEDLAGSVFLAESVFLSAEPLLLAEEESLEVEDSLDVFSLAAGTFGVDPFRLSVR